MSQGVSEVLSALSSHNRSKELTGLSGMQGDWCVSPVWTKLWKAKKL